MQVWLVNSRDREREMDNGKDKKTIHHTTVQHSVSLFKCRILIIII